MRGSRIWTVLTNESGFTLIELLGVAVILIVLALMALPVYAEVSDKAREGKAQEQLRVIEQALEAYRADVNHGHYPDTLNQLVDGGFVKPTSFETPWSSAENRIYYYYAVDRTQAATRYILGDAGPGVACPGNSACGRPPRESIVDPHQDWSGPTKFVRKSH